MRKLALLALIPAFLLTVGFTAAAAPPPSTGSLPSVDPSQGGRTIPVVAKEAGSFDTLLAAAEAAGLVDALSDKDAELTVFAPTDNAFKKLPDGTVEDLLKPENKDKLAAILKYHVVKGKVMASDVVGLDGEEVETLGGKKFMVNVVDGKVRLNGKVKVTKTDIEASNGVIHVINQVLMPPGDEE